MIPDAAHFVWLNTELPWINLLALHSAALRGGFSRIVLHHQPSLGADARRELEAVRGLSLSAIEPRALLLEPSLRLSSGTRERLYARYLRLSKPAAKSNVLRVAILAAQGGVYLDMDTLTLRELTSLGSVWGAFCGTEHVAFPSLPAHERKPFSGAKALARSALRAVLARAPSGWRAFRRLARHYPLAANNAVLGAAAEHPLLLDLLERMSALPEQQAQRRFALGTHLLQAAVRDYGGADLHLLPPAAFYPLGPVLSEHWFRYTRSPALSEVLSDETRVVHWYASLRSRRQQLRLSPGSVERDASRQLFSALVQELGFGQGQATKKNLAQLLMP